MEVSRLRLLLSPRRPWPMAWSTLAAPRTVTFTPWTLAQALSVEVRNGDRIGTAPAVANGVVYVGSWLSTHTFGCALNASTGALIWKS